MAKSPKKQAKPEVAPKGKGEPRKEWHFFMNTAIPQGGSKEDSELVAAFTVKGGISKEGKPYLFLDGFSKTLGKGVSINIGHNIDKLMSAMEDAGFLGVAEDDVEISEESDEEDDAE